MSIFTYHGENTPASEGVLRAFYEESAGDFCNNASRRFLHLLSNYKKDEMTENALNKIKPFSKKRVPYALAVSLCYKT